MNSIIVYSIIHSLAAVHHVSYFPSECCQFPARIAKVFALPTPKCSHFRYPDDEYIVRPTWKLYRKQGLCTFVNGGVWGFLPFRLGKVNHGVFRKINVVINKIIHCVRITSSECMEFRIRWRQMASQLRFLRPQYQQHGVNRRQPRRTVRRSFCLANP